VLRKLLRQLLKDNRKVRNLKGGNEERGQAVSRAQNLLALLAMSPGRDYVATYTLNHLIATARSVAADQRTKASIRTKACHRLCVIEGVLGLDELSNEPVDALIRELLSGQPQAPTPTTASSTPESSVGQKTETMAEMIARISKEHEGG
jgi:hypothetical protein